MLLANKLVYYGLPITYTWRKKQLLFANNMSYRLRSRTIISDMTNIASVIMQNVITMSKIMFFMSKYCESSNFSKMSRLFRPITFANDDIMTYQ